MKITTYDYILLIIMLITGWVVYWGLQNPPLNATQEMARLISKILFSSSFTGLILYELVRGANRERNK